MSLQNLSESFLYQLIPDGVLSLDEQGLIQAVLGGYQDRLDDTRSYVSKLEMLITPRGLPEIDARGKPLQNVVVCQIRSPQGKVYNRSLDIKSDTPSTDPDLTAWAALQLRLDDEHKLLNVGFGTDLYRLVDADVLSHLAATVGAVLYHTSAQDPDNADTDARRLIQTWFPRLQFKGTAESFETLGKLLGFDDVRMTPLWGRLSPRIANDIGDPDNDVDFSAMPEYWPKQVRDTFYDPLVLNDGPFFEWTGTATARFGTNSTEFYTQVVNGFNPFVKVSVVDDTPADPDSDGSPYYLVGGGAERKAGVTPPGSGLLFEAISTGSSFNGLGVHFTDVSNGTYRAVMIEDRLSAIKYRSSFFELGLTMDVDHALRQFGTNVAQGNPDLQATPISSNGTAVSPFRPWTGGTLTQPAIQEDWITRIIPNGALTVVSPRTQASLASRELNQKAIMAAGAQVVQAMEEVRPATRRARRVYEGYLFRDHVGYADYCGQAISSTGTS